MQIELGLDTFGDITPDATHAEVLRNVVEEAVLADELGIDFIGLGEHHRPDFAISAPEIVLAAIASRTKRISLGTSVTVLSTDDPIRVFERFSTLNAVSNGRAEVILGRGSFTESYPLFGFDLDDYETLFEEKVSLFAKALESDRAGKPFDWNGTIRTPLRNQRVYPPIAPATLKVWIGVGGSPESVVRAARYRFPLMLAIIGGDPKRFRPYVDLYERTLGQLGSEMLEVGVHSPGHIADTDQEAKDQLWPAYREMRNRIGAERGWPPTSRAEFEHEVESGSLYAGSPDTVAKKIASTARTLALSRFDLKYSSGPLRHDWMLRSLELYGREVIPRVRALLE
ncbi:MAG TPA: LLM class flavin-dependent oxidoreductase [Thermoanaerobaculia bacterium]